MAAGGGGDVIAASILRRKLGCGDDPFIVAYSWDRLLVDPLPGPRDPSWFIGLEPFGDHNHLITEATALKPPAGSLLPRLARELDTRFFLLDPRAGVRGMRDQLVELVKNLDVAQVFIVDSGGDILAHGGEVELRSPLADSMVLAASDGLDVPVDVLVTAAGLDGELSACYVRATVDEVGGVVDWNSVDADDTDRFAGLFTWHPSEVNGLLIAGVRGFRGKVEIRDHALRVRVDTGSSSIHRCSLDALLTRNKLAQAMIASASLTDAELGLLQHRTFSELEYQRGREALYDHRHRAAAIDIERCVARLLQYSTTRPPGLAALTLRRAAEVMEVNLAGLHKVARTLAQRFPDRFEPPLWLLR